MSPQKRIAAIHDLSGLGKCSLTVALPVISAAGVECSCIPTALLSTHTGEFEGFTFHDLTAQMLPIAEHWAREGARFDGIYSGYLSSPAQAETLSQIFALLRGENTRVFIDPVMADNGVYYSKQDGRMCEAFRMLLRNADVVTPNLTEAAFLTGLPYRERDTAGSYTEELLEALLALGAKAAVITGVHRGKTVGMAAKEAGGSTHYALYPEQEGLFYGTGDLFASAFAALTVRGVPLAPALDAATGLVKESILRTVRRGTPRRYGVDFEGALADFSQRVKSLTGDREEDE